MSTATRALEKEHYHTKTSKKTMNSKRTVTVAKAVPIVFAQREKNATRMVWLRAMTVEANATSVVEGRGRNATTGGDDAYDIKHKASRIRTAGGATHRYEAKPPQPGRTGAAGRNVEGATKSYDGAHAAIARQ
jgi:hypothetical protein